MGDTHMKPDKKRSSRGKRVAAALLVVTIAVVSFLAGIMVFIRVGLKDDQLVAFLAARAGHAAGKEISFSSARIDWLSFEKARITIGGLECRDGPRMPVFLKIHRAIFELRLLPVLRRTLLVKRAEFSEPVLVISSSKALERNASPEPAAPSRPGPFFLYPVIESLEIDNARVEASSLAPKTGSEKVIFSKIRAMGKHVTVNGAVSLKAHGTIPSDQGPGLFDLSGNLAATPLSGGEWRGRVRVRLTNCSVKPLGAILSHFGNDPGLSRGVVNLLVEADGGPTKGRIRGDVQIEDALLPSGPYFGHRVSVKNARVNFVARIREDSLDLEMLKLALPGMKLVTQAAVRHRSSPDPTATITVNEAVLDLKEIFPLVPLRLISAEDRKRLLKAGLKGRIVVKGAMWTGRISRLFHAEDWLGSLALDARLERVSGFIPGYGLPVREATGGIRLSADELRLTDIRLILGTSPIILNGWVTDLQSAPRSNLFVSLTANGEDLVPILENKALVSRFPWWLQRVTKPRGHMSMKLHIKGDLSRPSLNGRVSLDDFQCRVQDFRLPLKGMNGAVEFRKSGPAILNFRGFIGGSPIRMRGKVLPEGLDVKIESDLLPGDLRKLGLLPAGWKASFKVPVSVSLKGNPENAEFFFQVDLKGNRLSVGSVVDKKPGVPLRVEISGNRDAGATILEEVYLILNKTRVSAKGAIDKNGRLSLKIHLPPKGIATEALVPFSHGSLALKPGGRFDGDAVIKGSFRPRDLNLEATILFNHVSLHIPGFYKPMKGGTGRIRLRKNSLTLVAERAQIGNSMMSGHLFVSDFKHPKLKIKIESSFLDTTDFTAPPEYVSDVSWGEWIRTSPFITFLARSNGTASVKVVKGKTAWRRFADFQADFKGRQGLIEAQEWKLRYADGVLSGNALLDVRAGAEEPLKLDFQGDHLNISTVLLADPEQVSVEGDTLMDGEMAWKLCGKHINMGLFKEGRMKVSVRNGVIHRFEALSKIFSLLNLGFILRGRLPDVMAQGLPFERSTWSMDIFDDKWQVKDFKLASDAARITASGLYFSNQQRVDFLVTLAPLVGLDTLWKGLFGNLLTKDGKTLTTTFRVRGLYSSPDVRLLPLEPLKIGR